MIREYNSATDKHQVLELSERLMDFEFPKRIDTDFLACIQRENFLADLERPEAESVVFVAEEGDVLLGFIELHVEKDWISKQRHGHIARIAVAADAEGKGIAKRLMAKADQWCQERDFPMLSLSVFKSNERAIAFYQYLGYEIETVKMVKCM